VYVISLVFQRETYPPVLLKRKVKKLRKETGNFRYRTSEKVEHSRKQVFLTSILRPIKMLVFSPIILGLSLLTAVAYGILYLLFTIMAEVFKTRYGIVTNVGLVYLGAGVG
jgi:hypothetical protein